MKKSLSIIITLIISVAFLAAKEKSNLTHNEFLDIKPETSAEEISSKLSNLASDIDEKDSSYLYTNIMSDGLCYESVRFIFDKNKKIKEIQLCVADSRTEKKIKSYLEQFEYSPSERLYLTDNGKIRFNYAGKQTVFIKYFR